MNMLRNGVSLLPIDDGEGLILVCKIIGGLIKSGLTLSLDS